MSREYRVIVEYLIVSLSDVENKMKKKQILK